ncbi:MAG: tetratricopeptide repeat protein [Blastocatellia bacterium]
MTALSLRSSCKQLFIWAQLALLLGTLPLVSLAQQGAIVPNSGFVVFGRVSLPDGKPATRVKVYLETVNGVKRDVLTDDQGYYEIRGLTGGRFRMTAVNPNDATMYSDPAESDSTRAYANRLQINIYLRYPMQGKKDTLSGMVNAAEAAQDIPKAARKAYDQGIKLQKENKGEQALTAFNQAIELYPGYFQALTERGNLLMMRNQLAEAEADFERALQLNGKYPPALRGIGYCQIQQKKFAAALGNLEKAFVLEPNVALTLLLLGYANLSLTRYEEAKQCLQQALKIGPESAARAHVYLAEIFAHEQKFKEAADELRAYLKAKPDAADAANLRKMEEDWRARSKPTKNQL